jgi:hypothetical protein
LCLEPPQLAHSSLKHSRVFEVFDANRSIEHVYTTWVEELELAPGREFDVGGFLDIPDAGLVEDAVEEYDDVAEHEAVAFDEEFGDVPAEWLVAGLADVLRGGLTGLALMRPCGREDRQRAGRSCW